MDLYSLVAVAQMVTSSSNSKRKIFMNKVYGIVLMNLAVMGMYASQADLDDVMSAIGKSDLTEAKHQWELLDRTIKSISEKKEVLEQLRSKAASVDQRKSYYKLALGALTIVGTTWLYSRSTENNRDRARTTNDQIAAVAVAMRTISALFIKDGITGLIYGEGSPKSARVRDYFEDLANKQ
jgi:hypothetical protein